MEKRKGKFLLGGILLFCLSLLPLAHAVDCGTNPTEDCTLSSNSYYEFAPGNYYLNDTNQNGALRIWSGVDNLTLNCNGSSFIGNLSIGSYATIYAGTTDRTNITIKNCNFVNYSKGLGLARVSNVNIINTTFSGINYSYSIAAGSQVSNISFINVSFSGGINNYYTSTGISTYNLSFDNCNFTGPSQAIYPYGKMDTLTVTNSFFNGSGSFLKSSSDTFNVLMKNNTFIGSTTSDGLIDLYLNNVSNITFDSNTFDSNKICLTYYGATTLTQTGLTIQNSIFKKTQSMTTDYQVTLTNFSNFRFYNNSILNSLDKTFLSTTNLKDSLLDYNRLGNSTNYLNVSNPTWAATFYNLGGNNVSITNNIFYLENTSGPVLSGNGVLLNNSLIRNNSINFNNDLNKYGIVCGDDGGLSNPMVINCTIEYNNITAPEGNSGRHDILLGWTNNSKVGYNNVFGGTYGYVIKGNYFANVSFNTATNNSAAGIHEKGGNGDYYYKNILNQTTAGNYFLYFFWANSRNISTQNCTFVDNIFNGNTLSYDVYASFNNTGITIINTTYSTEFVNNSGSDITRKWYYSAFINDTNGNTLAGANISIYNSSNAFITSYLTNSSGAIDPFNLIEYFNNGSRAYATNYTINVTKAGYSDYSAQLNLTTNINSVFTLSENVAPNITLVSPADSYSETSSSATIDFEFNVSDDSSITNCTLYWTGANESNTSAINKTATNTISETLTSGTYSWYVICTDSLGNVGNSSTRSITIAAPAAASSSSGGSTFSASESALQNGYTQRLVTGWKVSFKSAGENHQLKLNKVTADQANITVSSTPQTFLMSVGEEKKIDLNSDGIFDLLVKLNSVGYNLANITLKNINEKISSSSPDEKESIGNGEEAQENGNSEVTVSSGKSYLWTVVIALVVVLVIVFFLKIGIRTKQKVGKDHKLKHRDGIEILTR